MGKGGQNNESKNTKGVKKYKLEHLADEELRKWAKAYYVNNGKSEDLDRQKLLEELNPLADGILDVDRPKNLPLEPVKFTLGDIKNSIPAHCFERNFFTSMGHVISDLVIVAVLGYLATWIDSPIVPPLARYALWPMYWVAQGCVMTGVWVLAHECGHQAFSESELINNTVGTILHSFLLVPYHSWRITHAKHHNNTGSCDNDEVFNPATRSDFAHDMLKETPLACAWGIFVMLTVGWMPGYLVFNATGPAKYRKVNHNHFSPSAAFFDAKDYWLVVQSDIAFFMVIGLIIYAIMKLGFMNVLFYYLIPYFVVNHNLVLITFLQHTDVYMPHFRGSEWNWLRGALCTVDRSFGPLIDHTFHHITDTHVLHHIFSKMPFYHAQEATEAFKKVLGNYYMKDDTPISKALWRAYSCCQFVEDNGQVLFYKNMK